VRVGIIMKWLRVFGRNKLITMPHNVKLWRLILLNVYELVVTCTSFKLQILFNVLHARVR